MTAMATAERLKEEALRLHQESRSHKKRSQYERKLASEKRQRAEELVQKCHALGVEVVFEPNHAKPKEAQRYGRNRQSTHT